jgi:hypothetical protein
MARTHGTRSSYNAGCRCHSCREASRLARARQRATTSGILSVDPGSSAFAPDTGSELAWGLIALFAFGAGGLSLWHGATMQTPADP